jgi:hypothetical protein
MTRSDWSSIISSAGEPLGVASIYRYVNRSYSVLPMEAPAARERTAKSFRQMKSRKGSLYSEVVPVKGVIDALSAALLLL